MSRALQTPMEENVFLFGGAAPNPPGFTAFGPEWTNGKTPRGERGRPRRPRPFRPLSRRSGRIPALPYPPLRSG